MFKRILLAVLSLSLFSLNVCVAQAPDKESAAVAAAEQWLALIDTGKYAESWKESAAYFRNAISQQQWQQSLSAVRAPLGKVISRAVKTKKYLTAVPGAPAGEYVVIHFATSYEKKAAALEMVTPMLDKDGKWRVSGFYIH